MRCRRWRTLLSLGLIGCMTLSLMPLGCSSVKLHHYPGQDDRPRIPGATEERLKECVEELKGTIDAGFYSIDAKVKVDEDGDVVGVETEGTPNPDVGACMRLALRGMRLPEEVLERGVLRGSGATSEQATPDRAQIGEVVTIVVVTVVFTEIVIEAVAITLAVAVTATATAGVAEAIQRRKKPVTCGQNLTKCLDTDWGGKRGSNPSASLCEACFRLCRDNVWPSTVDMAWGTESCEFPGFTR